MTTAAIPRVTTLSGDALVRAALGIDAAVSGLNGAVYLGAADVLDGPLGLPAGLLRGIGAFFLVWTAALAYTATRPRINRSAVVAVIVLNLLWVADSIALVALDWYDPTTGGAIWVVLQALVVAGFAALQAYALRRAGD
jgi:hypothetical protein